MSDAPIDLSDAGQVRDRTRDVREREDHLYNDLMVVLSTTEGRRFAWWILSGMGVEGAGLYEDPMAIDPQKTAYRVGVQASARRLMSMLQTRSMFHLYASMVAENTKG